MLKLPYKKVTKYNVKKRNTALRIHSYKYLEKKEIYKHCESVAVHSVF